MKVLPSNKATVRVCWALCLVALFWYQVMFTSIVLMGLADSAGVRSEGIQSFLDGNGGLYVIWAIFASVCAYFFPLGVLVHTGKKNLGWKWPRQVVAVFLTQLPVYGLFYFIKQMRKLRRVSSEGSQI